MDFALAGKITENRFFKLNYAFYAGKCIFSLSAKASDSGCTVFVKSLEYAACVYVYRSFRNQRRKEEPAVFFISNVFDERAVCVYEQRILPGVECPFVFLDVPVVLGRIVLRDNSLLRSFFCLRKNFFTEVSVFFPAEIFLICKLAGVYDERIVFKVVYDKPG